MKAVLFFTTILFAILIGGLAHSNATLRHERDFLRTAYLGALGLADRATTQATRATDTVVLIAAKYAVTVDELRREKQRAQIVRYILTVNPKAPAWAIAPAVLKAADATGIDPSWLLAKLKQESYFNPFAVSSTGCRGLAQICRAAAADMGLPWDSAFDIDQNVRAGAEYLKRQLAATGGSMDAALTRYNGGDDPLFVEKIRRHRAAILRAMA